MAFGPLKGLSPGTTVPSAPPYLRHSGLPKPYGK